jgi:hypothetical protein
MKLRTKYDKWCFTTTEASSRKKLKRLKAKAHRQLEKKFVNLEYMEVLDE